MGVFTRIFRRRKLYGNLADEMRAHIEEKTEQFMREGMRCEEAAQAARCAFGNLALIEERGREAWQWPRAENLIRDLSFSARLLRRSPGFALVAILTLTLGVGANTAMFSLLNGLLLRPLPVPEAQRLVLLRLNLTTISYSFCAPLFRALEANHDIFSQVFAFDSMTLQVRDSNGHSPVPGSLVSGEYFQALGVAPELGRALTAKDDSKSGTDTGYATVISDGFWAEHFHRDPAVLGRTLVANNVNFTIVGVMPKSFIGADANFRPQIYIPLVAEPQVDAPYNNTAGGYHTWWLRVGARLKPGSSLAQANAALSAIAPALFREVISDPKWTFDHENRDKLGIVAESGSAGYSALRTGYKNPLLVTFALCVIVLLLACINLASLLLARAARRQREIATRLAIGATRARLVQQLLIDSLLLAVLGTGAGLAIAPLVSRALAAMLIRGNSGMYLDAGIDWRVFLFAFVAALVSTVLVGLLPALQATAGELNEHMKDGSHATHSSRQRRLPKILLGIEVALAMVLVSGAGLLGTSLMRLYQSGFGFEPHGLLMVDINAAKQPLQNEQLQRLYRDFYESLSHLPGVSAAAYTAVTPLSNSIWMGSMHTAGGGDHDVYITNVSPGYFGVMHIPMFTGRDFVWQDTPGSGRKIIINQAAAKMFFPAQQAVGRQLREMEDGDPATGKKAQEVADEVVAVVGDTKYSSLRETAPPMVYYPMTQVTDFPKPSYTVVIRADRSPDSLVAPVRQLAARMMPDFPAPFLSTMERKVNESVAAERVMAMLAGFFAASALLVTGIGLYGVLSYSTARRTSEIGIRMALGAERGQVVSMVFRENAWVALTGCAIGLVAALLGARALKTFLYGTSPRDPWVLTLSLGVLCLIAAIASLIPAIRAASVDPMKALRTE